jgi:hypothetical protein
MQCNVMQRNVISNIPHIHIKNCNQKKPTNLTETKSKKDDNY